jgi:2-keto-4-pentenoate hydratase/2-oxohepta-3-ene-1,7-dioic acid hydratase in catechol pathway
MRIGRINVGSDVDFAIHTQPDAWVPLSSMGVDAPDTPSVIQQAHAIRVALAAGLGHPLRGPRRLECPILRPGKMLAIGLNYVDHLLEVGREAPERPIVFAKYPSSLNGPYDPIVVDHRITEMADYESELAVVIGRRSKMVTEDDALATVFGYAVANDVSDRDWGAKDSQLSRSKSYDTFCPIGPWITTADDIADPQCLRVRSYVNGDLRQDSTTKNMVFSVARLVEFLSQSMTLDPGDIILTGTPSGVGFMKRPPVFLRPEDVVCCEIEGLGRIENRVVLLDGTSPWHG